MLVSEVFLRALFWASCIVLMEKAATVQMTQQFDSSVSLMLDNDDAPS